MPESVHRVSIVILAALTSLFCLACASSGSEKQENAAPRSAVDPWEPMNRYFHKSSTRIDRYTLKPIAKGYQKVVPEFMRRGIGNFSKNLRSPLNIINHFLQGKAGDGFGQTGRFLLNSTVGVGGLFDVARAAGIDQKDEDFGQTLAVWSVPDGPYIYVPLLGPRTLRDALMIPPNFLADPLYHYEVSSVRDKVYVLRLIDVRARLLRAENMLGEGYDPYIALREAYLQRRRYLIYDGDPPEDEDLYEDIDDEFEDEY